MFMMPSRPGETPFFLSSPANLFLIISLFKKKTVLHKAVLDVAELLLET